jgi:hypothetical protein
MMIARTALGAAILLPAARDRRDLFRNRHHRPGPGR